MRRLQKTYSLVEQKCMKKVTEPPTTSECEPEQSQERQRHKRGQYRISRFLLKQSQF